MRSELVGVGVEAVERGVEDPRAEVGLDDLRNQLETSGQAEIGVLGSALLLRGELLQPAARLVGRQSGTADEAQQRVVASPIDGRELIEGGTLGSFFLIRAGELELVTLEALDRGHLGLPGPQCQRHRPAAHVQTGRVVAGLRGSGNRGHVPASRSRRPSRRFHAGRLPDLHRSEVRPVRVGIADPLHDRQPPALEHLGHRRPSRGAEPISR